MTQKQPGRGSLIPIIRVRRVRRPWLRHPELRSSCMCWSIRPDLVPTNRIKKQKNLLGKFFGKKKFFFAGSLVIFCSTLARRVTSLNKIHPSVVSPLAFRFVFSSSIGFRSLRMNWALPMSKEGNWKSEEKRTPQRAVWPLPFRQRGKYVTESEQSDSRAGADGSAQHPSLAFATPGFQRIAR